MLNWAAKYIGILVWYYFIYLFFQSTHDQFLRCKEITVTGDEE